MGELHWYINQEPPPADAGTAMETLEYLEACNLLFERGFLSHDRVRGMNSDVILNINKGFSYFTEWLDSLLRKGTTHVKPGCVCVCVCVHVRVPYIYLYMAEPKFAHTSSTQKSFLSWQSKFVHAYCVLICNFYSMGPLTN